MSEIRDFFIKTLDETDTGIVNMMRKVTDKLKENDPIVESCLVTNEIFPQYYSFRRVLFTTNHISVVSIFNIIGCLFVYLIVFRWLTLLLSQEFSLPEVLRIWDSLFSDTRRFSFLIDICCAMIVYV